MSEDLVSGLLAAIEQHQKDALSISAGRFVEGMAGRQVDPELSRYLDTVADPDAVIRLCRAHRDIIDEWKRRKQVADQLGFGEDTKDGDAHLLQEGIAAGLFAAVALLAEGYGLTEEGD